MGLGRKESGAEAHGDWALIQGPEGPCSFRENLDTRCGAGAKAPTFFAPADVLAKARTLRVEIRYGGGTGCLQGRLD